MSENDFQQIKIKDLTEKDQISGATPPESGRGHFLKFVAVFTVIIVIIAGGYFIWDGFLSPSARQAREAQENYQKYLDQQTKYEAAMKADTAGGKTPEETLSLFEEALRNQDVDSAASYFLLDDNGEKNPLIKQNIQKIISENRLTSVLDILSKLRPSARDTGSIDIKEFVVLAQQGFVDYSVTLKLNKFSNVWKIENM